MFRVKKEELYLSIGEMAHYSGIPEKTLRYYDEIGLLSPAARDGNTRYRFYLYEQLERAMFIQSLKALGMSLREIKQEFDNLSSKRYIHLLELRKEAIHREVERLTQAERDLGEWIGEVNEGEAAQPGVCFIRDYPEQRGYFFHSPNSNRMDHELALRRAERACGGGRHIGRIRRVVDMQDVLAGRYLREKGFFIPETSVERGGAPGPLSVLPAGSFACVFVTVPYESTAPYWDELLLFIERSGFAVSGDAVRTVPVEIGISKPRDDYISKISIPVVKKAAR